jgi:hypothetical protein
MTSRVLVSVLFAAAAFVLLAKADDPAPAKPDAKSKTVEKDKLDVKNTLDDQAAREIRMQALYSDFKSALLRLSQRMANSPKKEDQDRAKLLQQALEKAQEEGIDNSFDKLVTLLKAANPQDQAAITKAMNETDDLVKRLRAILALLMTDNRDAELKRQIAEAQRRLEELKRIIREQETVRTRTELGRGDKDQLGKQQNVVTKDTDKLANGKGKGEGKEAKPGEGKGEGKNGGQKGEGKNETSQKKGDEKKPDADQQPKKDPNGDAKGEGKKSPSDPQGEGKKPGDPNGQQGDKKNDGKPGEQQKGDSRGKSDGKGEGKGGKPSDGQGQQGQPKSGQQGGQQGGAKGSGQQQQQNQQQKKDDQPDFPGRKQIQDANQDQQNAEKDIDKGQNDAASKKQADATKKLQEAQKKLEELLRQLREEEIERILAALQARCEKMLAMQKDVREGTITLDKVMKERGSQKIDQADAQRGLELSDKENAIVKEADTAIELLRGEGSAVAFPVVFDFVRDLMVNVEKRLRRTDPAATTVATEDEIIASLEEMIDALKKARKENGQQQGQPGQGNPNPGNQPLLQLIQELKMIRNMQLRVNRMTETYGKEYKGEQAPAPEKAMPQERQKVEDLQKELKGLAERQEKIYEVTNDLYKGKNK